MKIIAITQRIDTIKKYHEHRDALDQRYGHFLAACGLIPLIIPNNFKLMQKLLGQIAIHGIVLTGGNETIERTTIEKYLLNKAISEKLPVLGICHGMQVIQRYFGMTLYKVEQHVSPHQEILINGVPETVNSFHDYGTTETHPEFIISAKAYDGVVKAIHHKHYPFVGIMWHPERMNPFSLRDINLVKGIFS